MGILLGEFWVFVFLVVIIVLWKFCGWFIKGFLLLEYEQLKLGLFFILVMFFKKLIKNVNGGYIVDFCFLYFVVFVVYLFCRYVGNFVIIGFILVGELKCLNSDVY